jgi:2-dehydropantoate 2-reductase
VSLWSGGDQVRFIVFGAGAIGGVVGGRLLQHGFEVGFIARGEHGRAMASGGLRLVSAADSITLRTTLVAAGPEAIDWRPDDVVLLAVKSQDTLDALTALSRCARPTLPVVCLQNGVSNERMALRLFDHVYGVTVMCPASHIEPGTVVAHSSPIAALLDIGRYPSGEDEHASAVAAAFNASGMESVVRADIMRWKYAKLLMNLSNAVDAVCVPEARGGTLTKLLMEEAVAVLRAAGIEFATRQEDSERRGQQLRMEEIPGHPRVGSSSRQSLVRGVGSIEADYLNGEIVLLGRLHGVATPANEHMQWLANRAAHERWSPGLLSEDEILEQIGV